MAYRRIRAEMRHRFLDPDDDDLHPVPMSFLEKFSDIQLMWIARILMEYVQERGDFAIIWETFVLGNMMRTADRCIRIVRRRRGSLDVVILGQADQLFIQRVQEHLLVQEPQQEVVVNQAPQQLVIQQRQQQQQPQHQQQRQIIMQQQQSPNIMIQQRQAFPLIGAPDIPHPAGNLLEAGESAESWKDKVDAAKVERKEKDYKRKIEDMERAEKEEKWKSRYEQERKQEREKEELYRRKYEEEQKKKREEEEAKREYEEIMRLTKEDEYKHRYEEEEKKRREQDELHKRRLEEEQRRNREHEEIKRKQVEERKKLEYERSHEYKYNQMLKQQEEKSQLKRLIEAEQKPETPPPEPSRLSIQESAHQSDSDSDSDSDEEDKKFDPYEAMGLSKRGETSTADIKAIYNTLSMRYHPDKQHGKSEDEKKHAEKRMSDINWAKEILLDNRERRQAYDEEGIIFDWEFSVWQSARNDIKKAAGRDPTDYGSGDGDHGGIYKGKNKYIPP